MIYCETCGETTESYDHHCKGKSPSGVKYDDKKLDYTLLPKSALDEVVKVLMYGARKYPEPDNWLRVPDARNRYNKACLRHMFAEVDKETFDKESKLYHLAHAVASSLFALYFAIEKEKVIELFK